MEIQPGQKRKEFTQKSKSAIKNFGVGIKIFWSNWFGDFQIGTRLKGGIKSLFAFVISGLLGIGFVIIAFYLLYLSVSYLFFEFDNQNKHLTLGSPILDCYLELPEPFKFSEAKIFYEKKRVNIKCVLIDKDNSSLNFKDFGFTNFSRNRQHHMYFCRLIKSFRNIEINEKEQVLIIGDEFKNSNKICLKGSFEIEYDKYRDINSIAPRSYYNAHPMDRKTALNKYIPTIYDKYLINDCLTE